EGSGRARVVRLVDVSGVGASIAPLQAAGIATESLVVQGVGGVLANVGTDAVYAEPRGTGPDLWTIRGAVKTTGFDRGDVVRVVASYRPSGTTTFLPWGAEEVALDETGSGEFSIPLDLPGPGEVQVRGPEGDHLPADDATVLSLKSDPVRVAIVGDGHPALLRALAS